MILAARGMAENDEHDINTQRRVWRSTASDVAIRHYFRICPVRQCISLTKANRQRKSGTNVGFVSAS